MADPTVDPWADDPKVSAVRKFRQALEAKRALRESGGYGALRVFAHGASIGTLPYVAGALGGIEAKLAGRPWAEGYRPAVEEERRAEEAQHTLHPIESTALGIAGSVIPFAAAGPLASGEGIAGRLAAKYGGAEAATAASEAYQASRATSAAAAAAKAAAQKAAPTAAAKIAAQKAALEAAKAAARKAALEASPLASRVLARGIGGAVVGTGQAAAMGAIDTPGGPSERAAGALRSAPWGAVGAVLEPAVGEVAAARAASREAIPNLVERMRGATKALRTEPAAPPTIVPVEAPAPPVPPAAPPAAPAAPAAAATPKPKRAPKAAPAAVEPPPIPKAEATTTVPAELHPSQQAVLSRMEQVKQEPARGALLSESEHTAARLSAMRPEIRDAVQHALDAPDRAELERRLMAVVSKPMSKEELGSVVELIAEKRSRPFAPPPAANEPPPVPVGRPTNTVEPTQAQNTAKPVAPSPPAEASKPSLRQKLMSENKLRQPDIMSGIYKYGHNGAPETTIQFVRQLGGPPGATGRWEATGALTDSHKTFEGLLRKLENRRTGAAPETAAQAAAAPAPNYKLPKELAGAKPRYGFAGTNYTPEFESDVDKALYIVAQNKPSKSDRAYMDWLGAIFPDMDEGQIRSLGQTVRAKLKSHVEHERRYLPAGVENIAPFPDTQARSAKVETVRAPAAAEQPKPGAYRGYLVRQNSIGRTWIEKDGIHIASPNSVEEARRAIDELVAHGEPTKVPAAAEQPAPTGGEPPASAPAEPPPLTAKAKHEPLSTPEDRALAELKRAQQRAADAGKPMGADESVAAYEAALSSERKARGITAPPEEIVAPTTQPAAEKRGYTVDERRVEPQEMLTAAEKRVRARRGQATAATAAPQEVASTPVGAGAPEAAPNTPEPTPKPVAEAVTAPEPERSQLPQGARGEAGVAGSGGRQPLAGPRGREAETVLPDGERVPVRYRVVEAEDLNPSHSHATFQKNPEYPEGVQGREYHLDETAKQQFEGRVARYDPKRALDVTEEVGSGPPTITPDGTVVAGNERTMMAQRVAETRPEKAAAYRAELEARAEQLGIDPAEIRGMKAPVLVREMTSAPESAAALRDLNRRSDVSVGKAKDAISDATTRARTLAESSAVHAHLVDAEQGMQPGETLRAYAASSRGKGLVDELITAKVIEPSERAAMMDAGGKLNEHGLDTVERAFEAAAVGDPDVLARAKTQIPGVVNKMEHAVPAIVRANGYEGWGIEKPLAEALDILGEAKAVPGGELEGLLSQGSMFGNERSEQAVTLARALENASKSDLKLAAHEYARSAREAATQLTHDDLFGFTPKTPEEAFGDTFGKLGKEKPAAKAPVKKATAKRTPRNAGFATNAILRPIVGGMIGASVGAATGETPEQKIERAAFGLMLGVGISVAPEIQQAFFHEVRQEAGVARTLYRMSEPRPTEYIRAVGGKAGEYLAQQVESVTQRSYKMLAVIWSDAQAALKGLTHEEQIVAKKWADGRPSAQNASVDVKHAGQKIRVAMDVLKDQGAQVGVDTSPKQGRAFPQALNADGEEVLQRLQKFGVADPKVQDAMQAMVDEGIATDLADAATKFQNHKDVLGNAQSEYRLKIKGIDPYLQSPRFHMPEKYVDWTNDMAWKASIRRSASTIEAARAWGPRWEDLHTTLAEIGREAQSNTVAADIQGWLSISFGGVRHVDTGTSRLTSAIARYEVIAKLGNALAWVPNRFQSLTNLSHLPAATIAKMTAKYPPFLRQFGLGAADWAKLVEDAERSGAVVGYTGIHELPEHMIGKITDIATRPFSFAQLETEREAAILAPVIIKHDIEALQNEAPQVADGLTRFLNNLTGKSYIDADTGELAGNRVRRLQTMGLSPQRVADAVISGRRLKPDELEAAAFFLNQNSMFSGTVLSRPIWLSRNPALAPLFIFKGFPLRQFEYIYGTLWKEAQQGNVAPMAKFVASTIAAGEAYHVARDLVFGSDRSAILHAANSEDGERTKGIAKRLLVDMAAGGGTVMIYDLMYGLTDWLSGSVINTVKNARQTLAAAGEAATLGRYGQVPRTLYEGAKAEFPVVRQAESIMRRIHAKAQGDSPFVAYEDLRNDARRTVAGYSSAAKDAEKLKQILLGYPEFDMSPNTIPYRTAAVSIQNGDPVQAGKYLTVVAKSGLKNGQDVNRIVGNMRSALTSRGPLGGFSADERDRYLKGLAPDKKRAARDLTSQWTRTQERAITYALRQARAEIKAEPEAE